MLNDNDRFWMDKRDKLTANEMEIIDAAFQAVYATSHRYRVPTANDDRAASLEAALVRFLIESREE